MINHAEPHNWCDKKHTEIFKVTEENKSEKLHTSVESYIKMQIKNGLPVSPDAILDNMRN